MADAMFTGPRGASAKDSLWYALEDWRTDSACRDLPSDVFFAEGPTKRSEELAAKGICASCVVIDACLADAIAHNVPFGVWGGLTTSERRPLRRAWASGA